MGRLLNAVAAGDLETARLCVPGAVDGPARDALREVLDGIVNPARRDAALETSASLDDVLPTAQLALWYAALDRDVQAFRFLEQAFVEGNDPNLPFFLVHPIFDGIRRNPRFRAIAEAIGVETV